MIDDKFPETLKRIQNLDLHMKIMLVSMQIKMFKYE